LAATDRVEPLERFAPAEPADPPERFAVAARLEPVDRFAVAARLEPVDRFAVAPRWLAPEPFCAEDADAPLPDRFCPDEAEAALVECFDFAELRALDLLPDVFSVVLLVVAICLPQFAVVLCYPDISDR
jgi:hypothetical protein